jgi:phosphate transport system substrate-binding protein
MRTYLRHILASLFGLVAATTAQADISGAGATFPYPLYAKWAEAYKAKTNVGLNYQSIGSGGGIKQIKASTVVFGASDKPLSTDEVKQSGLVQFPATIGVVVPVVNIPGVKPGDLILDGPTLASIYLGDIKQWNDPRIARLNPGLVLPKTYIAPVYRSDGSGTNFLFTTYLAQESAKFKSDVGAATSVEWPTGIGAKGNEGVANMATLTVGAIGYVEYAYAKQNKMTFAKLKNRAGGVVTPEIKSFQTAAANVDWSKSETYSVDLTDQPGAGSWPITGASFILMRAAPKDAQAALGALKFFSWAYAEGGSIATALDYVPLPEALVKRIEKTWTASITANGAALWPAK